MFSYTLFCIENKWSDTKFNAGMAVDQVLQ